MFVQVIRARVRNPAGVEEAFERWRTDLRPGAPGFLGSTGGITEDGQLIAIARFESEEQARRNSDRPEQGAWWAELERHLDGPATFEESTEVDVMSGGGSDDAGFVQVISGHVKDRESARQAMAAMDEPMRRQRPDVIGGYVIWHDDRKFTNVVYFRSEREAREGERRMAEMPADLRAALDSAEMASEEYLDLKRPMLMS